MQKFVIWLCIVSLFYMLSVTDSLQKINDSLAHIKELNNIDTNTIGTSSHRLDSAQNDPAENSSQELIDMWVRVQNNSTKAIIDIQEIDEGKSEWHKQNFKGIIGGHLDPFGFSGAIASFAYDLSAEQMVQQVLTYLSHNNKYEPINQIYDVDIGEGMTLSRSASDSAADKYFEFQRARAQRMFEQQFFIYMAQKAVPNLTASEIAWMWNIYQMQRPYADSISKTPNPGFLNTWHDYVTPGAFEMLRKTGKFEPPHVDSGNPFYNHDMNVPSERGKLWIYNPKTKKVEPEYVQGRDKLALPTPQAGYVRMRAPNGQLWDVPSYNVDAAIQRGLALFNSEDIR